MGVHKIYCSNIECPIISEVYQRVDPRFWHTKSLHVRIRWNKLESPITPPCHELSTIIASQKIHVRKNCCCHSSLYSQTVTDPCQNHVLTWSGWRVHHIRFNIFKSWWHFKGRFSMCLVHWFKGSTEEQFINNSLKNKMSKVIMNNLFLLFREKFRTFSSFCDFTITISHTFQCDIVLKKFKISCHLSKKIRPHLMIW